MARSTNTLSVPASIQVDQQARTAPAEISRSLDSLNPGQSARVSHIETPISVLKNRLLALGLVNNTPLYVKNIAPLGDPMSIEVRGFCLSMRKDEAHAIKVVLED